MPTNRRRAAGRRRAWGRGPVILRFEPLERREVLSTVPALPDLVGAGLQVPTSLTWGQSFEVKGVVQNVGTSAVATPIPVAIYASPGAGLVAGEVTLGVVSVPAGLQPGAKANIDTQITLPATAFAGITTPGSLYLGMQIDPANQIAESNKLNNAATSLGVDTALVSITATPVPNLAGAGLQVSTNQTEWGGSITVTQQVANVGNADAPATTTNIVLTPSGVTPGGSSDVTVASLAVPALAAGQSTTVTGTFNLPSLPPSGVTGAGTYTLSAVSDADYVTNALYPHVATQGAGVDQATLSVGLPSFAPQAASSLPQLAVANVGMIGSSLTWGQNFQVTTTIQNSGAADSGPFRVRFLLVGTDGSLNGLFLGDTGVSNVAAGASTALTENFRLPAKPPGAVNSQGVAKVAVVLDPEHALRQSSTTTNVGFSPVLTLNVVNPDGTVTPIATPGASAAATTTTSTATARAAANTLPQATVTAARKAAKPVHTFSHNLKVFPTHVEKYFKNALGISSKSKPKAKATAKRK